MDKQVVETIHQLKRGGTAVKRGDFLIAYQRGRWLFLGMKRKDEQLKVSSVHFMSDQCAAKTLCETPDAKPKAYEEISFGLTQEITSKALNSPKEYLTLFRSGKVDLSGGFTTDTTWRASYSEERERAFLKAVAEQMKKGNPGLCLIFPTSL
jgi:hypothetical protein